MALKSGYTAQQGSAWDGDARLVHQARASCSPGDIPVYFIGVACEARTSHFILVSPSADVTVRQNKPAGLAGAGEHVARL